MSSGFMGGLGILQPTGIDVKMDNLAAVKRFGAFGDIIEAVYSLNTTAHTLNNGKNDIIFTQNGVKKNVKILTIKASVRIGFSVPDNISNDILLFKENSGGKVKIGNKSYSVVCLTPDDLRKLKADGILKNEKLNGMPGGKNLAQGEFNQYFDENGGKVNGTNDSV